MVIVVNDEKYAEKLTELVGEIVRMDPDAEIRQLGNVQDDLLDAFCLQEAQYRLSGYHGIGRPDDGLVEDAAAVIRDVINHNESLYDAIDDKIEKMLEERENEERTE